ncbi:MAG: hypothetical protein ABSH39_04955 [Candidatus Acidiferrum sp.]|jgi:hypothetical protein
MNATVTKATKSHSSRATRHAPLLQQNENHVIRVNHLPALFLAIPAEDRRSLPGAAR